MIQFDTFLKIKKVQSSYLFQQWGLLKDDAISQLSGQLVALSTRLQEIERRQQLQT
jgi:hypothetical protein